MPPKVTKKTAEKAASKIVEDKTFGMKNKNKSKKVQQYVKSVQKNVQDGIQKALGTATSADAKRQQELKKQKEAQAAIEKEMAMLMKSAIKQPPLEPGVDPKSVVCEFFKAGCCSKGDKCKFSHDLTRARKGAKINIYADARGAEGDKEKAETNADWDQAKLEEVVAKKEADEGVAGGGAATPAAGAGAGPASGPKQTEIVCKYFLDAIEKEIYGWFWTCPNGGSACKYRHALPPGFVYKSKKQREAELAAKLNQEENGVSIEEEIEEARKKLPSTGLTPVNAETFAKWREARAARKLVEAEAKRLEDLKKAKESGGGKGTAGLASGLSGRALFEYNPALFVDDEAAGGSDEYVREEGEEGDEEDGAGEEGEGEEDGDGEGGAAAGAGAGGAIDEDLFAGEEDLDDELPDDDEEDEEGGEGEEGEEGEAEEEEAE